MVRRHLGEDAHRVATAAGLTPRRQPTDAFHAGDARAAALGLRVVAYRARRAADRQRCGAAAELARAAERETKRCVNGFCSRVARDPPRKHVATGMARGTRRAGRPHKRDARDIFTTRTR